MICHLANTFHGWEKGTLLTCLKIPSRQQYVKEGPLHFYMEGPGVEIFCARVLVITYLDQQDGVR